MWLVLCGAEDLAALWAYRGLQARGLAPIELVTADLLACSLRWEHRLGAEGVAARFELADGRRFDVGAVRGVLNRVMATPEGPLSMANPADRAYGRQEFHAFLMSLLHGLPGVVMNHATAQGLSGTWRHGSEWSCLAAQAGLPTMPFRQSSRDTIGESWNAGRLVPPGTQTSTMIVVDGCAGGVDAPAAILAGCERLARLDGSSLLGVELLHDRFIGWVFAGATPWPNLRLGGDLLLDRLARALRPDPGAAP